MTYALVALMALLVLAYFGTVRGFANYLSKEREQARDERERLVETYAKERETLLNRIQHPQTVPPESLPLSDGIPKHIPFEDDEGFQEFMEQRAPVTD
jgi:hypothetical protein